MSPTAMHLRVLLPFQAFAEAQGVSRIVAETGAGSFGLLPHRLDCVAALVPGILVYQREGGEEICLAVDDGVLVKSGTEVVVSVRRAAGGATLEQLRNVVEQDFLKLDQQEQTLRSVMAKLETGLLRRLASLDHD